jgi:hypothetical protein
MTSSEPRKLKIIRLDQSEKNVHEEPIQATKKEILRLWNDRETGDIGLRENIRKLAYQLEETGIPTNLISSKIKELFKANKSLCDYIHHTLEDKYKRKYTRSQIESPDSNTIEDCSVVAEEVKEVLQKVKYLTPEDIGRGEFQDIAQLIYESRNKLEHRSDEYNIPLPYETNELPSGEKPKIRLKPTDIPKSEQLRLLQEMEGRQMYAMSRMYKNLGDSLIKMNYVPDDPKISEKLIAHNLREMLTLAFTSLQLLNEFLKYFERFKSKEKLTDDDKEIIRALMHISISHLTTGKDKEQ